MNSKYFSHKNIDKIIFCNILIIKQAKGTPMNKNKDYLVNTMDGNDVYILTTINDETTNELVAQLAKWVNTLKPTGQSLKLYAPYAVIPNNHNVLNVYINSNGGKTLVLQSILTMFHIASAKGAIIKTYNLAHADSSASLLAISGTKGYRYMAEDAYNTVILETSLRM